MLITAAQAVCIKRSLNNSARIRILQDDIWYFFARTNTKYCLSFFSCRLCTSCYWYNAIQYGSRLGIPGWPPIGGNAARVPTIFTSLAPHWRFFFSFENHVIHLSLTLTIASGFSAVFFYYTLSLIINLFYIIFIPRSSSRVRPANIIQ